MYARILCIAVLGCDAPAQIAADAPPAEVPLACVPPPSCPACDPGQTCGGGGLPASCGSRGCTRFVAPDATAAWSECTTSGSPCALATANLAAAAGDVICLAPGDYHTAIAPAASGTPEAPIVYRGHAGIPRIRGVQAGIAIDGRSHIEIDSVRIEGGTGPERIVRFFELRGAREVWIRNVSFRDALAYYGSTIDPTSSGVRITGCTFEDAPHAPIVGDSNAETWPADMIYSEGDRVLIADNHFGRSSHYGLALHVMQDHRTVVRGNVFANPLHAGLNLLSWHEERGRVLVERNRFLDQGSEYDRNPNYYSRTRSTNRDDGNPQGRQVAVQLAADMVLFRRNELAGNGRGVWISGWFIEPSSIHPGPARLAHNTFVGNLTNVSMANDVDREHPFTDVVVAHNLFHAPVLRDVHGDSITAGGQHFTRNGWTDGGKFRYIREDTSRDRTLAEIEASYPGDWQDNASVTPAFVDAAARDLRLAAGSPGIDRAGFLTTVTVDTAGTVVEVADPTWFFDGWTIPGETGDLVMTARGAVARVIAVDLLARTLTLDRPLAAHAGEGIGPPFTGASPDLGAHEHCAPL